MTALLLTIALAAGPVTIAAPGLSASGLPPDRAAFLSEYVATQVRLAGLKIITQKEISAMLGMERQKQLLGCTDSSSCVAEIAAALGTDAVLIGDVALFGTRYVATLKVLRAENAQVVSLQSIEAGNEDAFLEAVRGAASRLTDDTLRAFGGEPMKVAGASGAGVSRNWALLPAVLAIGSGIATPFLFGQSASKYSLLVDDTQRLDLQQGIDTRNQGRALQMGGWITTVTAGVMLAAAVVIWFVLGDKP